MFNSLFVNASILICFLYLGSQLFTDKLIDSKTDLKTKLSIGILFGLTGCFLMFNGINLSNHMIMDFRVIALMISALYCGPVSAGITALIIIAFRFGYFGASTASLTAILNLTILYVICSLISGLNVDMKKKYIAMCFVNILSSVVWTSVLIKDAKLVFIILSEYALSTIAVSIVVYFVLRYLYKTNELYLKLKQDSTKDFLTGLYNVRAFDHFLNELSAAAAGKTENLSLLMIDIDYFKKVNDTYGHASGDLVLKQLGVILAGTCRQGDVIARKGGEEFTMILPDCSYDNALEIGEKIRKNVETYQFMIDKNKKINITVSVGAGSYPQKTADLNDLLYEADSALYLAKRSGRNTVK